MYGGKGQLSEKLALYARYAENTYVQHLSINTSYFPSLSRPRPILALKLLKSYVFAAPAHRIALTLDGNGSVHEFLFVSEIVIFSTGL